jgi:hypothetical protein
LEGIEQIKESTPPEGIHQDIPLNVNSNIKYENQDCKIGTVCAEAGVLMGGGGWRKEIKVTVYDRWTTYTCMKQN